MPHDARRKSESGATVATVLVVLAVVVGIGILAAIGVQQFDDYGVRARVSGIYYPLNQNKSAIAQYVEQKGAWPTTWKQLESVGGTEPMGRVNAEAKQYLEDIRLERDGVMIASFKIEGKTGQLRLTPTRNGNQISWACSSSPEINWFMPPDCRAK